MTGDPVDRASMAYGRLSDFEMAGMLMRDTLEHEAVCCGARDRIMYLSQQLAALRALIEAHNAGCDSECQARQAGPNPGTGGLCAAHMRTSRRRCPDCPRGDRIELPGDAAVPAQGGETPHG